MKFLKKIASISLVLLLTLPALQADNYKKKIHQPTKSIEPGKIILLNGTSSAGKTTLIKALHELYTNFEIASIDEYTKTHQCCGFVTMQHHGFYKMIHQKACAGTTMLVDTVLYHTRYEKYDAMLQAQGIELIKILVYCPINYLVAHVQKRNLDASAMEHRSFNQAFRAFLGLYTMKTKKYQTLIDTMHSTNIKAALQKTIIAIAKWSEKNKKRQHATNAKIARTFNLKKSHKIALAPKHHWDLIVTTGINPIENIASTISEFIDNQPAT